MLARAHFAVFTLLAVIFGASPLTRAGPRLSSQAAVLIDVDSGRVLYARRALERRAPASLTKVLTALVVLDRIDLNSTVRVSAYAAGMPGSRMGLRTGERLAAWKLFYGMLFRSGNDAAVALAEHVGGSVRGFARLMNEKARALGALDSNFVNPHGLDASGHYTTAYDMAVITRAALHHPVFARVVAKPSEVINWNGADRQLTNINAFLWRYDGATGVKTGYTSHAGYSLVASAQRDGRHLAAVLLHAPSSDARWDDAPVLMDYGFTNWVSLVEQPDIDALAYVVRAGDTLSALAARFGVSTVALARYNGLKDPDKLWVGQRLMVPTGSGRFEIAGNPK